MARAGRIDRLKKLIHYHTSYVPTEIWEKYEKTLVVVFDIAVPEEEMSGIKEKLNKALPREVVIIRGKIC